MYEPYQIKVPGKRTWRFGRRGLAYDAETSRLEVHVPVGNCAKPDCFGHATPEDAEGHFRDYLLDTYLCDAQTREGRPVACEACAPGRVRAAVGRLFPARFWTWFGLTSWYASVLHWTVPLCRRHRTREEVGKRMPPVGEMMR